MKHQRLGNKDIHLEPYEVFNIEDQAFPLENDTVVYGSGLMIFTGLIIENRLDDVDLLHCVPLHFYGKHSEPLTQRYKGRDLWIEISIVGNIAGNQEEFPQELLN